MNKPKEIIKKEEHLPSAEAFDYSAYAGMGFESHTREDYAVPFLTVLQALSPQIETIPSARPGMLFNTVTNELYDGKTGVAFVPAETQHVFVEWRPRELGGGFIAVHPLHSEVVRKAKAEQPFGKYKVIKGDKNSNDLIETYYVYGILVKPDGSTEKMIITFTSTKISAYKHWMTKARTVQVGLPDGRKVTAPLFAHRYRIKSEKEENPKGSFFNFYIPFDGLDAASCRLATNDPIFQEAVDFRKVIQADEVKVAHDKQVPGNSESEIDTPFA